MLEEAVDFLGQSRTTGVREREISQKFSAGLKLCFLVSLLKEERISRYPRFGITV